MPVVWFVLVTSWVHSSWTLTFLDKSLPPPREPGTIQEPVLLPCKSLKAMFFSFPISLGFAGPTGDNDSILGRVRRLPMGCGANCRRFVVSFPFTLKTFQKERSIWIVFTIHLKVSSNTVGTWQWYDFSIITQLPNRARCPPSPQERDSGCLHSCPATPWANSVSQFLAVWSMPNRKILWMNGIEGYRSGNLVVWKMSRLGIHRVPL